MNLYVSGEKIKVKVGYSWYDGIFRSYRAGPGGICHKVEVGGWIMEGIREEDLRKIEKSEYK